MRELIARDGRNGGEADEKMVSDTDVLVDLSAHRWSGR